MDNYKIGVLMSRTLDTMLENGKGFRSEGYIGSGVRDAEDVIRHELSMGNTDIVDFVQNSYRELLDIVCGDEVFDGDEGLELEKREDIRNEAFSDLCQENAPYIAEAILKYAGAYLKCEPRDICAIWLTSYEGVMENYTHSGEDMEIDEYPLVRGAYLVISDLGEEGALFLY